MRKSEKLQKLFLEAFPVSLAMAMSSLVPRSFENVRLIAELKERSLVCFRMAAQTLEGSPFCPSMEKFSPGSCSTGSYQPCRRKCPRKPVRLQTNRGITDMVFVLRQLLGKCREQNKGLHERLYTSPRPLTPSAGKASG